MEGIVTIEGKRFSIVANESGITVNPVKEFTPPLVNGNGILHPSFPMRFRLEEYKDGGIDVLGTAIEPDGSDGLQNYVFAISRELGVCRYGLTDDFPLPTNGDRRIINAMERDRIAGDNRVLRYPYGFSVSRGADPVVEQLQQVVAIGANCWRLVRESRALVLQFKDGCSWTPCIEIQSEGYLNRYRCPDTLFSWAQFASFQNDWLPYEEESQPKAPAYVYDPCGIVAPAPIFWMKNEAGLDIYVGMVQAAGGEAVVVMCDKDGKKLERGNLLWFEASNGEVCRASGIGWQYPGELEDGQVVVR